MSTAAFTEDELLSMSLDLSGGGQSAGDGGGDVLVASAGTRTRTGAGDEPLEPVLFDAERGAATEGGSGGSAGGAGGHRRRGRGEAELGFSMEAAAQLRDCREAEQTRGGCGCICGPCGLIGFTRFGPLTLCGLICGFVGAIGAGWPSGLAAWPAPLASLIARKLKDRRVDNSACMNFLNTSKLFPSIVIILALVKVEWIDDLII